MKAYDYDGKYLILEVARQSLQDRLKAGRMHGHPLLTVADEIVTALKEMHDIKLCHMDLKPGNIFHVVDESTGDLKVRQKCYHRTEQTVRVNDYTRVAVRASSCLCLH